MVCYGLSARKRVLERKWCGVSNGNVVHNNLKIENCFAMTTKDAMDVWQICDAHGVAMGQTWGSYVADVRWVRGGYAVGK